MKPKTFYFPNKRDCNNIPNLPNPTNNLKRVEVIDHLKGKPFPTLPATDAQKEQFRKYFIENHNKKN